MRDQLVVVAMPLAPAPASAGADDADGGILRVTPLDVLAVISFFYLARLLVRRLLVGAAPTSVAKKQR